MDLHRCSDKTDYFKLFNSPSFGVRWQLERLLAVSNRGRKRFTVPGFCAVCLQAVEFRADYEGAWQSPEGIAVPNWRERLCCPQCGMNGRQRVMTRLLADAIAAQPEASITVYLMEIVSPVYEWLRAAFPRLHLIGSEYFGPSTPAGSSVRGMRHEDAEQLSLADASVDLLLSCDVFEHVNDPHRAFGEVRRVLRPGGRALMTFPMDAAFDRNRQRAVVERGTLRLLEPAVYHGNPLSPKGALVFTDFGWEVLSQMRVSGLVDPSLTVYWGYELGYLGIQFYFESQIPRRAP